MAADGSLSTLASASLNARIVWEVAKARIRDGWSAEALARYRERRLRALLEFARARSPYYAQRLRGLEHAPLSEWPVLDKDTLIERWNDIVTDRSLALREAEAFLAGDPHPNTLWRGYRVLASSGTSGGPKAVFPFDTYEWAKIMASFSRLAAWREGLKPARSDAVAMVSSPMRSHLSAHCAATYRLFFMPKLEQVSADAPIRETVARLNAHQPRFLSCYPSALSVLADEQAAGRLNISLRAINANSEVLTREIRNRAERAFGVRPHNVYTTTEIGMGGGTCARNEGMHLQEDFVVFEIVDEHGREVPPGTFGSQVYVTVLGSRTLPVIRFALPDRLKLSTRPCACGRAFSVVEDIDGRVSDVLDVKGPQGETVRVDPWQIEDALERWGISRWQLELKDETIELRVVPHVHDFDAEACARAFEQRFRELGTRDYRFHVLVVPEIRPLASGKVLRVVA